MTEKKCSKYKCTRFKATMLAFLFILFSGMLSAAPDIKVSGIVKDKNGEALMGVNVVAKGTRNGTSTDMNGKFELQASPDAILEFTYVGYAPQNVKATKSMTVTMEDDALMLDQTVVVGYTRKSMRDVSSAVAKVDVKSLENNTSVSVASMLSGQAAGLNVMLGGSIPGAAGGGIVIRGNTSLKGGQGIQSLSNPLYIMDGIPMSLADLAGFDASQNDFLSSLNPNEIQGIDILKDAAATAIYGSRGANGVIIITTKRGTPGKTRVNADFSAGVVFKPQKLKVYIGEAERQEKLNLLETTMVNIFGDQAWVDLRNGFDIFGYALPSMLTDKYNPSFNNAYDFQDMFYQAGVVQKYALSIDGGTDKVNYRVGLSHHNEKGVLVGFGFNRTTINASLVNKINKYFGNDFSMNYSFMDRKGGLGDIMSAVPTSPTNLPSSLLYRSQKEIETLSGGLGDLYNQNKSHGLSFGDEFTINFFDGLALRNFASLRLDLGNRDYFVPSYTQSDLRNKAESIFSLGTQIVANSVLNYIKDIKKHRITVLAGTEINADRNQFTNLKAENGSSDYMKVIQGYKKDDIEGSSDVVKTNMLSYFGSLTYGFDDNKYQIEGVLRRDASSRFGANNKWATFPSGKVHWVFSKEPWMKSMSSWLDFGKIRVSIGSSGEVPPDPLLQYNSLVPTSSIGAGINGSYSNRMDVKTYGGENVLVSNFDRISNKSLSWAKTKEVNYGLDLELLNRRLFISGDIYSKYISGKMFYSTLPPYLGYNKIMSNLVDMINSGFELSIIYHLFPRTSKFQWEWQLNLARNNSKIAKLGNGGRDYIGYDNTSGYYALIVGEPAFQYYMPEYLGTLNSMDDIPVHPITGQLLTYTGADGGLAKGPAFKGKLFPGMPLFTDVNGDFLIDSGSDGGRDVKIIEGKSPEPKISGGLHTTMRYKGFSLRINSSFAFGHYIFNTTLFEQLSVYDNAARFYSGALYQVDNSKFWTGPNDGSYYPMRYIAYVDGGSSRAFRKSSMYLEKGDYWSIDQITLSYNFTEKLLSIIGIKGLNVYSTLNNAFLWKKSGVFDPRLVNTSGYYNGNGYPISRMLTFGAQIKF